MKIVIKGAHLLDPKNNIDEIGNIYIENGTVRGKSSRKTPDIEINAKGLYLIPGLVDIHSHFREPGKEDAERDKFQLACYGLFAIQEWDIKPENVILTDYFLSKGKQNEYNFKNFELNQIQDYIKNSIVEMKEKLGDTEENIASEGNFPFTENEQTCKYCNYYKACPKYAGSI